MSDHDHDHGPPSLTWLMGVAILATMVAGGGFIMLAYLICGVRLLFHL